MPVYVCFYNADQQNKKVAQGRQRARERSAKFVAHWRFCAKYEKHNTSKVEWTWHWLAALTLLMPTRQSKVYLRKERETAKGLVELASCGDFACSPPLSGLIVGDEQIVTKYNKDGHDEGEKTMTKLLVGHLDTGQHCKTGGAQTASLICSFSHYKFQTRNKTQAGRLAVFAYPLRRRAVSQSAHLKALKNCNCSTQSPSRDVRIVSEFVPHYFRYTLRVTYGSVRTSHMATCLFVVSSLCL